MMCFQSSVQVGREQRELFQMLPGKQRTLTKISVENRRLVLKLALCFSSLATSSVLIGTMTNNWLYTMEWLKYYQAPSIRAASTDGKDVKYFKNATLGPWIGCFSDPTHAMFCRPVVYWNAEEPSDVTQSVEQAVTRATYFLVCGAITNSIGLVITLFNNFKATFYPGILVNSILHIFSGMFIFLCLIVYMASLAQEVGRKLYPASPMDEPLFFYSYGYSFLSIMLSFLCTELTALFTLMVYMANRDEKIFRRFHIQQLVQKRMIPTATRNEKSGSESFTSLAATTHGPGRRGSHIRSPRGSYMRAYSPRTPSESPMQCPSIVLPLVMDDNHLRPTNVMVNGSQCFIEEAENEIDDQELAELALGEYGQNQNGHIPINEFPKSASQHETNGLSSLPWWHQNETQNEKYNSGDDHFMVGNGRKSTVASPEGRNVYSPPPLSELSAEFLPSSDLDSKSFAAGPPAVSTSVSDKHGVTKKIGVI